MMKNQKRGDGCTRTPQKKAPKRGQTDSKGTQDQLILAHLLTGKTITPIEALRKYGTFRLSARVFNLRKQGYNVVTDIVYKNGKHFASYSLLGKLKAA